MARRRRHYPRKIPGGSNRGCKGQHQQIQERKWLAARLRATVVAKSETESREGPNDSERGLGIA